MRFFDGLVLAIETSCDETSAAVVRGSTVLSNVIASQAEMHLKWGGIVPEAAARAHVEAILPVIRKALTGAGVNQTQGIAVTNRPGLVGALSVGVSAAKALSLAWDAPMVGVHHLEGHILSTCAGGELQFPHVCLMVSGGHTELVDVTACGHYRLIGQTLDDAAGEAFDKGARLLGLGYPGGLAIEQQAMGGNRNRYPLPRSLEGEGFDFSFSGLKTAMLRLVEREGAGISVPDAASSLQAAIVEVLADKALRALDESGHSVLTLVGGVAANTSLRQALEDGCRLRGARFIPAAPELCTDNAAMIGIAGAFRLGRGERSDWTLDVYPNAPLPGA